MSKRLSFYTFFLLSFCVIVFFPHARRSSPPVYYIIMCVHFTYQFVRVDVCAVLPPPVSFQIFPFCVLLVFISFHTSTLKQTHTHWYTVTRVYISIVHAPHESTSRIHLIMPIAREYCSRRVRLFVDHYYSPVIILYYYISRITRMCVYIYMHYA